LNNTFDISPTLLVAHLHFYQHSKPSQKMQKSNQANAPQQTNSNRRATTEKEGRTHNRRLAKVAVQYSADTFVVNQTFVLRINICGENATFAKRQTVSCNPPYSATALTSKANV
jgi:hypothetical protein